MPRTCSNCEFIFGDEQRGLPFCPACGELLHSLASPSSVSSAEPETTIAPSEDRSDHSHSGSYAPHKPVAQYLEPTSSGPLIPETRYPSLPAESKSPAVAALLSFLLVGMGQVYLGQVEKGLTMLIVVLLLMFKVVLGPLGVVILLLNVLDAFLLARKLKKRKRIRKWEFFFQSN
jgi:hypothetical protein